MRQDSGFQNGDEGQDIGMGEDLPFPPADMKISETLVVPFVAQDRPPLRPRGGLIASSPSRVWIVSFTDIMGLMLTFFVMTYAMSELQTDKFKDLTSMMSQASGVFSGPPLAMGAADTVPLARVRYRQGLDANYLAQVLERKKEDVPALAHMTIQREGRNILLSFPIVDFVTGGDVALVPTARPLLYELAAVLNAIPNQMEILVQPVDDRDISRLRALGQGQVILAGFRQFGDDLALPVIVSPVSDAKNGQMTIRITRFLATSRRG